MKDSLEVAENGGTRKLTIYPLAEPHYDVKITVTQHKYLDDTWNPPHIAICWPGGNGMSAESGGLFVKGMQRAIKQAEKWEKEMQVAV